jgi:hypothetical protein
MFFMNGLLIGSKLKVHSLLLLHSVLKYSLILFSSMFVFVSDELHSLFSNSSLRMQACLTLELVGLRPKSLRMPIVP